MKLFLTSYRLPAPEALFSLVGKGPADIKVAVIPNAKDYYADRARAVKVRLVTDYLQNFGLLTAVVDLRAYSEPAAIEVELSAYDLIWVMGGNTFCLMHEIRRSGLDKALPELLEAGVVYAGESAGAVAVGTSLKGIESADDPEFAESVIYDGLGIVPYVVLPHSDDESFADANAESKLIHPVRTILELRNSDAAIYDGRAVRLIRAED